MASRPSSQESIPVVVIGWGRNAGVTLTPKIFSDYKTPYNMTAMMDFVQTLEKYHYSPQTLGAVLHNLHPRPWALVVGVAVPPSLTDEIQAVWDEYVDTALKPEFKENDEWKKNACVHLQLWYYINPSETLRPPTDLKWGEEMCKQLDAVFRPEVTWD